MRFVLTAEQQTMRDAVQRLVDRTIRPEIAISLAQRAYELTIDYAMQRRRFGKPIEAYRRGQKNSSYPVRMCIKIGWRERRNTWENT